jgi:hypothetical protein
MTLQMVCFTTTEAQVAEVEEAIGALMAAVAEAAPAGTRYAATRLADGVTFMLLLELDAGVENPLPAIPGARAFQQRMPAWAIDPPAPQPVAVLGSYGLFAASLAPQPRGR